MKYKFIHLFSGASMVAQTVKNPSAMREAWVRSLGWEDPLETGMAAPSTNRGPWWLRSTGPQRLGHGATNSTAYDSKRFSSKKKKNYTKITCVARKYELRGKEGK